MEEFEGSTNHARYVTWLEQHPEGFVLQCSPAAGIQRLHRANCRWIGAQGAKPRHGDVWTANLKRCSTDRDALIVQATDQCKFCRP
jgi:hypothetical protein